MVNRTLWAGFGGVLILIAVCGTASLLGFRQLQRKEQRYRVETLQRNADLQTVREAMLLSGTLARDYLFWPDRDNAADVRARFHELERESAQALARWQGDQTAGLRGEVRAYWKTLGVMLEVAGRERRRAVDEYFYRELSKRREAALSIADQVGRLQLLQRETEQRQLASFGTTFSAILAAISCATLLLGTAIAIVVGRKLIRMQAETHQRQCELEALSARLVTAQEEERKAVARELHDQVGQMLTALSLQVRNHASPHLEAVRTLTESLIVAVRDISLSLRPSMLDDFGLVPALEWHAREVHRRSGIQVIVDACDDDCEQLAEPLRTCVYRVAQEALRNCERHAKASRAALSLKKSGTFLQMTISDNGQGFDTKLTRGLGMLGMQERADTLGGSCRVESTPGAGTTVVLTVPLNRTPALSTDLLNAEVRA